MLQLKTTSKLQKISMNVNLNLNFLFLFKNALSHSLSITHIFHSKNFFIWSFSKYPSLIKNRRNRTTTKTIPFPTPQPLTLSIFSSLSRSIYPLKPPIIFQNIYIYILYCHCYCCFKCVYENPFLPCHGTSPSHNSHSLCVPWPPSVSWEWVVFLIDSHRQLIPLLQYTLRARLF